MAQQHTPAAGSGQTIKSRSAAWALGGEIVSTPHQARRVLRKAILANQQYLIPQARSVLRKLEGGAA